MDKTMMVAGYVWTGVLLFLMAAVCVHFGYTTIREKLHAKRMRALQDRTMAAIADLERRKRVPLTPWQEQMYRGMQNDYRGMQNDFPRPMSCQQQEAAEIGPGWIAESRFFVEGDSDAEIIYNLMKEAQ